MACGSIAQADAGLAAVAAKLAGQIANSPNIPGTTNALVDAGDFADADINPILNGSESSPNIIMWLNDLAIDEQAQINLMELINHYLNLMPPDTVDAAALEMSIGLARSI